MNKNQNIFQFIIVVFFYLLLSASTVWSADYTITQITTNDYFDVYPKINSGQIVWQGYGGILKFITVK